MARISGKPKTEFCVKLPLDVLEAIDTLVAEGYFAARSDVIAYSLYRKFFEGTQIECVSHGGLKRLVCFRIPRRLAEFLVYESYRECGSMSDLVRSVLVDFLSRLNVAKSHEEEDGLELLEGRPVGPTFKYRYMENSHV